MGEAQEVKSSRLRRLRGTLLFPWFPKGDQAGFVWVNCQPVLREALGHHVQYPAGILLVGEADHEVIRKADEKRVTAEPRQNDLMEPLVQDIMQVHIRQDR